MKPFPARRKPDVRHSIELKPIPAWKRSYLRIMEAFNQ